MPLAVRRRTRSARRSGSVRVGDQHQRGALLARLGQQQVHDQRGGGGVEVARGLVGQQQAGAVHQGAGNGHAAVARR